MREQRFQKGRLRKEREKDQERESEWGWEREEAKNGGLRDTSLGQGCSEMTGWG